MNARYVSDLSSNARICGETLIYTAGCLAGKTGIHFLGCTFTFADDDAREDWRRLIEPHIVSSVAVPLETESTPWADR